MKIKVLVLRKQKATGVHSDRLVEKLDPLALK